MARLLRARGEDVALLALLDTYAPGYTRWRPSLDGRGTLRAATLLLEHHATSDAPPTLRLFARAARAWVERARSEWRWRRDGHAVGDRHTLAAIAADHAARYATHPPADVRVELFRSIEQPPREQAAGWPDLGWRERAKRGLAVHELPGRHGDYHREPVLTLLVERLLELLAPSA